MSISINASDFLEIDGANISSSSIGRGNGGDIEINTGKLTIDNGGQIDVSTLQSADGGNLSISARESVELRGIFNQDPATPSSLVVGAQRKETTGNGGNLQLSTANLTLRDGAIINAGNFGQGDGGNIQLEISNLLLLRNNSKFDISTRAGSSDAGGNGGNIDIQAGFLVAFPSENSDIDANAFQGQGGRINIATQGVFGIEVREEQSDFSDITAFSQENPQLDGEVIIETGDTDLDRQFNRLPEDFIDFSSSKPAAARLTKKILPQLEELPSNFSTIYPRLNLAKNLVCLNQDQKTKILESEEVEQLLSEMLKLSQNIDNRRSQSFTWGYLGWFYIKEGKFEQALRATQQALYLAETIAANDIAYKWQWQLGYLFENRGDISGAIAAYLSPKNNY